MKLRCGYNLEILGTLLTAAVLSIVPWVIFGWIYAPPSHSTVSNPVSKQACKQREVRETSVPDIRIAPYDQNNPPLSKKAAATAVRRNGTSIPQVQMQANSLTTVKVSTPAMPPAMPLKSSQAGGSILLPEKNDPEQTLKKTAAVKPLPVLPATYSDILEPQSYPETGESNGPELFPMQNTPVQTVPATSASAGSSASPDMTAAVIYPKTSTPDGSMETLLLRARTIPNFTAQAVTPSTSSPTPSTPSLISSNPAEPSLKSTAAPRELFERPARSAQRESLAQEADECVRHGFELAGRGAYFAARSEFIAALRLVAQALDVDAGTTNHSQALSEGITAMKEADDFLLEGAQLETNLDIQGKIASHVTPVMKEEETAGVPSIVVLKRYLTFAQKRLTEASEDEVAGSMALRALGKLHEELIRHPELGFSAAPQKAVVYYQAALLVYPENYLAANDLGVLFARAGQLNEARRVLEQCATRYPQSDIYRNLSVVYERLGQGEVARQARAEAGALAERENARRQSKQASNAPVQWVDSNTFAQSASPSQVLSPTNRVQSTTGFGGGYAGQSITPSQNSASGMTNPHLTAGTAQQYTQQTPPQYFQQAQQTPQLATNPHLREWNNATSNQKAAQNAYPR